MSASRFFRSGNDSSSESSSDEEELYSDEEEVDEVDDDDDDDSEDSDSEGDGEDSDDEDVGKYKGASAFLRDAASDSESEGSEPTKKVKSAKDKRFDELDATITAIENAQKINDWGSISNGSFCQLFCVNPPRQTRRGRDPRRC